MQQADGMWRGAGMAGRTPRGCQGAFTCLPFVLRQTAWPRARCSPCGAAGNTQAHPCPPMSAPTTPTPHPPQEAMRRTRKLCAIMLDTLGREVMVRRPFRWAEGSALGLGFDVRVQVTGVGFRVSGVEGPGLGPSSPPLTRHTPLPAGLTPTAGPTRPGRRSPSSRGRS